ncbi:hypothetical protein BC834DRAFT_1026114 [Gloeopeniophorella convolvens]|nr:hypothetical protein BC834DRAFT_1026114 [Gloeopeniophorella convolvens]
MMPSTLTNIRVRTARDAEIIFHAVRLGMLPMVVQRLGSEERMALSSGCVYVWEERSGNLSESMEQGIERFTEGRSWVRTKTDYVSIQDFLFYHEKDTSPKSLMVERTRAIRYQEDPIGASAMRPRRRGEHMIKQTYSVYRMRASWYPDAYWTQETLDQLLTIDDIPALRSLKVPSGSYLCARTNRMRETAARSARGVSSESIGRSPSATPPMFAPYPFQHRPDEDLAHGHPPTSRGLSLAPIEHLERCRRSRRNAADERILRSFDNKRS